MLIKNMLEDVGESNESIPIPNVWPFFPGSPDGLREEYHYADIALQVNEAVLRKVVEWCEHHRNDPSPVPDDESDARKKSSEIGEWDQKFMQVDQEMLFEIILVRSPHPDARSRNPRPVEGHGSYRRDVLG